MARVVLERIHKTYAGGQPVLRELSLALADGELLVLVGPSGSGKSTALRIVAGLETPTSGRVFIGERDVTDVPPGERDVAMVFQSYALYPHMTVRENLCFGMRMRGVPKAEMRARAEQIAERLQISALLERKPAQLSGGQRQRVALGRALVRRPQVFLLDEPLSNLDAKLRAETRAEIARLHADFGVTTMYVTHDQEEAMTLGQRIAVLGVGGRLEQLAPPLEVYGRPANTFVAEFIGMPKINWFDGALEGAHFACSDLRLTLPTPPSSGAARVRLGVRPHDLRLVEAREADLRGRAELVEALGAHLLVHAHTEHDVAFRLLAPADAGLRRGDLVHAAIDPARVHLFSADDGRRLADR
jgi:ABC-type sugar transport system ATPase subunit